MLILFPVPIGSDDIGLTIPSRNVELLNTCHHFIVENERTARRNLKRMGYQHPIDDVTFYVLDQHTTPSQRSAINTQLAILNTQGHNVGLMSEAGLPCIADPGNVIVAYAQQQGIAVVPLVGPSSLLLALMASGLNGQNFAFLGYLPFDANKRKATLNTIIRNIQQYNQTQILIETPYRNNQLLAELAAKLPHGTLITVACDLTLPSQTVRTLPAARWLTSPPDLNRHYCVFVLGGQ